MPVYEFRCEKCGQQFEQRLPLSQASQAPSCPSCGGQTEKVFSRPPGIAFKGTGWTPRFGPS